MEGYPLRKRTIVTRFEHNRYLSLEPGRRAAEDKKGSETVPPLRAACRAGGHQQQVPDVIRQLYEGGGGQVKSATKPLLDAYEGDGLAIG